MAHVPINGLVRKMLDDPKSRKTMMQFIFGKDIIFDEEDRRRFAREKKLKRILRKL